MKKVYTSVGCLVLVAACGGGGSSGQPVIDSNVSPPIPNNPAEDLPPTPAPDMGFLDGGFSFDATNASIVTSNHSVNLDGSGKTIATRLDAPTDFSVRYDDATNTFQYSVTGQLPDGEIDTKIGVLSNGEVEADSFVSFYDPETSEETLSQAFLIVVEEGYAGQLNSEALETQSGHALSFAGGNISNKIPQPNPNLGTARYSGSNLGTIDYVVKFQNGLVASERYYFDGTTTVNVDFALNGLQTFHKFQGLDDGSFIRGSFGEFVSLSPDGTYEQVGTDTFQTINVRENGRDVFYFNDRDTVRESGFFVGDDAESVVGVFAADFPEGARTLSNREIDTVTVSGAFVASRQD